MERGTQNVSGGTVVEIWKGKAKAPRERDRCEGEVCGAKKGRE